MIIIDDDGVMHKVFTKANMVAMLEEIKDEAKKLRIQKARENVFGREFKIEDYDDIIQSKIDKLKGNENGNGRNEVC